MRAIMLILAACTALPLPLAAQTAPAPDAPIGEQGPIAGAKGVDSDVLCLGVLMTSPNRKAAAKPDPVMESAVSFFIGRTSARYTKKTLAAESAKWNAAHFSLAERDDFEAECLFRSGTAQLDIMFKR